jgi:hypothetical protein
MNFATRLDVTHVLDGQRNAVGADIFRAEQIAEKLHPGTSGAKALTETKGFIAALKTLRHPKSEFFSKL